MDDERVVVDLPRLTKDVMCLSENIYRYNGVWDGPDPAVPSIPLVMVQLTIIMIVSRICIFVVRIFKQPSFVGKIIGGLVLGPSMFGRLDFAWYMFPPSGFHVLEPLAHFSLCYFAFLTGLQMDIKSILRLEAKSKSVAVASITIPFIIGSGLYFMFDDSDIRGFIFWGGALAATGYPVLAQILTDQRIVHTEIGRTAMGAGFICDLASWIFIVLGSTLLCTGIVEILGNLLGFAAFILLSFYYLRGFLKWIIDMKTEGSYGSYYICCVLIGASVCSFITELCGTHAMIGAFVYGLCMPNETLKVALLDKLEDFVMELFMPFFYAVAGLRVDVDVIFLETSFLKVVLVIVMAVLAKPFSTILLSFINGSLPAKDAFPVGVFAGTKSIMALIILEFGNSHNVLTTQSYTIMILATLMMTMITTPISISYRPSEDLSAYKRRTIQKAVAEEELRILTCIHDIGNIQTIINLLTSANPSFKNPISVFALHLVELIGRAPATLVFHSTARSSSRNAIHFVDQVDQVISAFDNLKLRSEGLTAQIITAKFNYETMGEDICNVAKENLAAFIILPFCKVNTMDGDADEVNEIIRTVNEAVLINAPCSVGIFIDRHKIPETHVNQPRNIAMLYFGGPDDREAVSFALRIIENQETNLTVIRFESENDGTGFEYMNGFEETSHITLQVDMEKEKVIDDHFLDNFNVSKEGNRLITYIQLVLDDEEEATKAIKAMDNQNFDLYIVGKGTGMRHHLTAGLADWCDCPELGPIGDLLATSEFESSFSVLVVQQYVRSSMVFSIADRETSVGSGGASGHKYQPSNYQSEENDTFHSISSDKRDLNA